MSSLRFSCAHQCLSHTRSKPKPFSASTSACKHIQKAHGSPCRLASYDDASTPEPITAAPDTTASAEEENPMAAFKLELLKKIAGSNRGALASSNDKYEVGSIVEVLEESVSPYSMNMGPLQGKWELIYSSVEQFRSSPFFWAFQEGLVQDRNIASEIFKFTDSIPGASIGSACQTINLDSGKLVSEVDMFVFPFLSGTVVTTSAVTLEPPNRLKVTVQDTRVANSSVAGPLFDQISVPVQQLVEQIRGRGATEVVAEVTYLDSDIRITRTKPDNELFIYRKV